MAYSFRYWKRGVAVSVPEPLTSLRCLRITFRAPCCLPARGPLTGRSRGAQYFLVLAWAAFSGLMTSSFLGQLEETLRQTESEPHNLLVVVVKFLLWSVCVVSLVLSFRTATQRQSV